MSNYQERGMGKNEMRLKGEELKPRLNYNLGFNGTQKTLNMVALCVCVCVAFMLGITHSLRLATGSTSSMCGCLPALL